MRCPSPLNIGDKVALIAPGSPVDPTQIEPASELIRSLGYCPEIYQSCFADNKKYLAGNDVSRARDINAAFADPCIKAIIAMRGGYGSARLAKYLNYDIIRLNPKIFCGFSDVTLLHAIINQHCSLVTFHTPMPASSEFRADPFSMNGLNDILKGDWHREYVCGLRCISEGEACGILTGGNLTVIASTVGTKYQTDTSGKILFLEDVGEEAYRLDRYFVQLRDGGLFDKCRGIILGTWRGCAEDDVIAEMLCDIISQKNIPIIGGLQCGHSVPSISLPLGLPVTICSNLSECRICI